MTADSKRTRFTVIDGGGGAPPDSLEKRVESLRTLPPKKRRDTILSAPDCRDLVRAIAPPDLYLLVKEIGLADMPEIIEQASPSQIVFCLDLDIWNRWTPSIDRLYEWLSVILEGDEESIVRKVRGLDPELLILFLQREILVGGGLQVISNPEDQLPEYEHTFDGVYFISFRNREHSTLVARLLEILCANDKKLYMTLLEGVRSELQSDLEESAFRFREGRLADLGFPDYETSLSLYAYMDPDRFSLDPAAWSGTDPEIPPFPVLPDGGDLFTRCFAPIRHERETELTLLLNAVLMANHSPLEDGEDIRRLMRQTTSYLSLAIEYRVGNDEQRGGEFLRRHSLTSLFRLGFSLTMRLQHRAVRIHSSDAAVNQSARRALEGLLRIPPRFYRGFDDEILDGYREFRSVADLETASRFLDGFGVG